MSFRHCPSKFIRLKGRLKPLMFTSPVPFAWPLTIPIWRWYCKKRYYGLQIVVLDSQRHGKKSRN